MHLLKVLILLKKHTVNLKRLQARNEHQTKYSVRCTKTKQDGSISTLPLRTAGSELLYFKEHLLFWAGFLRSSKNWKMKHLQTFESFLNEGLDLSSRPGAYNDPVLVTLRASREDRKKKAEAQKERMKKRVYGKQREKLEDQLWDISGDLKDAYAERRSIYDEMEAEAGEKGDLWSDDDANRYGKELNRVDDKIESLIKKRNEIEISLAY